MKPLAGTRVLTLEQFGAAPYGTMYLADLGAEVIKVENPATGGDPSRSVGPHMVGSDSHYYHTWSINKDSVALDIKSGEGRTKFEELVASADALVNNLRGDQPEKLRLQYKDLAHINPRIVCLHISGYGRDNERRSWPGYDYLMQGEAGLMDLTGEPDGPPCRSGQSMIDFMTGVVGMLGMVSCLHRARTSGVGCDVDVSLFDVALHQLSYAATWYLNEGVASTRQPRGAHLSLTPVQTFSTADGWIYIMCMTEKFFEKLCEVIGAPEIATDRRFTSLSARLENRAELTRELDARFKLATTAQWLGRLAGQVPAGPILTVQDALDSEFVDIIGMIRNLPLPGRDDFRVLANPIRIDGSRLEQRPSPALGAGNEKYFGLGASRPASTDRS